MIFFFNFLTRSNKYHLINVFNTLKWMNQYFKIHFSFHFLNRCSIIDLTEIIILCMLIKSKTSIFKNLIVLYFGKCRLRSLFSRNVKSYCNIKIKCYSVIKMRKVQPHQACIITSIIIDLRMEPNSSYWAWSLTVFLMYAKNLSAFCKL